MVGWYLGRVVVVVGGVNSFKKIKRNVRTYFNISVIIIRDIPIHNVGKRMQKFCAGIARGDEI